MITEHFHYLMGLTNYFLFLELKNEKKEIWNQNNKRKNSSAGNLREIMIKNFNLNVSGNDLNYQTNKLTEQMDYHLDKAIKHFSVKFLSVSNELGK